VLLLTFLVIGVLLGWGLGGSARNLAHVRIAMWPALPVAVILQVIPIPEGFGETASYLPFGALLVSFGLLAFVAAANWRLRGFLLILVGVVLNAIPIVVNQGMPVSGPAVVDVGGAPEDLPRERGGKHHLATDQDALTFLGDVFPVRAPFREVVSLGDLLMYAGAAVFLASAMLANPERPAPKPVDRLRRPPPSKMWGSPR
jgi:hypothetical protein